MTETLAIAQQVQAAEHGDERAFEALFRTHHGAIYGLILHFVGDPELAADLTQDTFVKAWESLRKLRDPNAFGGWVRAMAINLMRDHFRRARQTDPLDEAAPIESTGESPAERAARREQAEAVRRAVLALPEHQRTVVAMHHLEGKPVDEIAREMSMPKGTVVSRLARGRKALRRRLARFVEEQEG